MTKIAGAIVVLAGAIPFSTGLVLTSIQRMPDPGFGGAGIIVGAILGLIGLGMLASSSDGTRHAAAPRRSGNLVPWDPDRE
jgi:hypothetical protein